MTDIAVLVERARHQARVERTMFGFKAGELYDALADVLESPPVALADANAKSPDPSLSSLRKGAEVAEAEIRVALAPWWKQVCAFNNMPGIPASIAGDELVAIVATLLSKEERHG